MVLRWIEEEKEEDEDKPTDHYGKIHSQSGSNNSWMVENLQPLKRYNRNIIASRDSRSNIECKNM